MKNRLTKVMELALEASAPFTPRELAAVLDYELSAPIPFDLSHFQPGPRAQVQTLAAAEGLLLKSFRDLFQHPYPPLALLILAKDFAKSNCDHPNSFLPHEVARVIYYTSIAVALLRCRSRITQLSEDELKQGFDWALARPWLDASSKQLLLEARQFLTAEDDNK